MLELVKVHDADLPSETKDSIKEQCVQILNDEWPRNERLRYRTLNASKEFFPMCLALTKLPENTVLGHVKLSEVNSKASAVWIESVVIHPDLRGQGIGKHLMLKTEEFCRARGFKVAYLCTIDRQVFYSRCGYQFCHPVTASSGTVSIRQGMFDKLELVFDNSKKQDEDLLPLRTDELGQLCSKVFQAKLSLPKEPKITLPLRSLKTTGDVPTITKSQIVSKDYGAHKDFMKKKL